MIELSTPIELIENLVKAVENKRKIEKLKQSDLAKKADIPLPTYKQFIYKNKISLENLFKLLIALKMYNNIKGLLKEYEVLTLEDIKNTKPLPKRIK